jgi:hypothetical protein
MSHTERCGLLEAILAGISDTRTLGDHDGGPSPLDELVKGYRREAKIDDRLPAITSESTGRELKDAVGLLRPEVQVALLQDYNHATKNLSTPTEYDPKVLKEQTKSLRNQVWWLAGALLFFMVAVLVGATIATAVHMNVVSEGEVLKNLLETAKEIIMLFLDMEGG